VPVDANFYLWAGSLCLSAAAVVLFIWLMRDEQQETVAPPGNRPEPPDSPASTPER
jgi:hypothetical protein